MVFEVDTSVREKLISSGIFLITEVSHSSINTIINWIISNHAKGLTEFTLAINSDGGSPSAIVYFASVMRAISRSVRLHGVAFGQCGSAALALLQCCHTRKATYGCGFFIHHINCSFKADCYTPDFETIRAEIEESKQLEACLVELQCTRSGIDPPVWKELADEGSRIPGRAILTNKALELGLIDEIVDHHPIF